MLAVVILLILTIHAQKSIAITCYKCSSDGGEDCLSRSTSCSYGFFGCIKTVTYSGGLDKSKIFFWTFFWVIIISNIIKMYLKWCYEIHSRLVKRFVIFSILARFFQILKSFSENCLNINLCKGFTELISDNLVIIL